jgi:hypothetical protein
MSGLGEKLGCLPSENDTRKSDSGVTWASRNEAGRVDLVFGFCSG